MLAIYSVPVAVYADSVPALPFVVGAAGFLWLLVTDNVDRVRRFGRRFTGDGRDVDVWEPSPLAAAGRRLAVVGVVAGRAAAAGRARDDQRPAEQLQRPGDGDRQRRGGPGGAPGRVNLFAALSGQLNQSEVTDLVKVTTDRAGPVLPALRRRRRARSRTASGCGRPTGGSVDRRPARPGASASRSGVTQQHLPGQRRGHQATSTCRCCRSTPSR